MDSRQSISAVVAHDIKNQLAIIIQAVAYLKDIDQQADDKIKTTLSCIEEAAMKIDKIVNNIVGSSRP